MAFLGKIFKSKELKAFEQALKNREYSKAIALGQSNQISTRLVREAKDRLALTEAFWAYGQDTEKAAYLDLILNFTTNPEILNLIKDGFLRNKILLGRCKMAILAQDFDTAISQAKLIRDKDLQVIALRKAAGFAIVDSTHLNKAIEAALTIPDQGQQWDALNKFSLSRVILGDFDTATDIVNKIPLGEHRGMTRTLVDFVREHEDDDIVEYEQAAVTESRQVMVLRYAVDQNIPGMATALQGFPEKLRANIVSVYAQVLALSSHHDAAQRIFDEIDDPINRIEQILYALSFIPFPQADVESSILETEKVYSARMKRALRFLIYMFIEMAFSNQMHDVVRILHKLQNSEIRDTISGMLLDDIYKIKTTMD